jgi:type I restriction enzyme S subunit
MGNIPYFGANGIQGYINKYIFDEDLILLAEDGGNFEEYHTRPIAYKISGKSWVNNHAHILRAKQGFIQNYIFYALEHKDITKYLNSGTRSKLNKSELEKIEIDFPSSIDEQQKIAKILSTADVVIEKTQAAIAKYKAIKQGMLHDLFTRGIDLATNKLRSRYEDAPHLYKESKLGMIPKEWEEVQLGQVGEFKNGINKDKNSFGFGTLFVNIGDAYIEALDCSTLNRVKVIPSEIHDYELLKGDLLFVRSSVKPSGIGYNTLFTEFYEPVVFCGFMIRYRFECKTEFIPEFYNSYFRNEEFRNRLIGVSTVSANTNINQVALSGLVAIKPQIKEQQIIAERLKSIDNKLQTEQTYLHKMQLLKKGLMEDLLSGRKRVKINIQNKC